MKSSQADVTCAFLHAELDKSELIFCQMPQGFKRDGKVLKLKRNLYGLKQDNRDFYKYTTKQMVKTGLRQSNHDPCLYINVDDSVICVTYVDDLLL